MVEIGGQREWVISWKPLHLLSQNAPSESCIKQALCMALTQKDGM
ncbi:hypothetical protein M948_17710 [Virgibacillus sp. CM-4]|nr:hypothetical protein M948_17710 [Virgibacillus sp. CM-4]